MSTQTFLIRTMSDTVETDIQRVCVIQSELLPRYHMKPLTFDELRKVADGPFDLFLIPILFEDEYRKDPFLVFREAGLINILMTTGGRRFKHQAMEEQGLGAYFQEIVDRAETYFAKEQGIYHLFRKYQLKRCGSFSFREPHPISRLATISRSAESVGATWRSSRWRFRRTFLTTTRKHCELGPES